MDWLDEESDWFSPKRELTRLKRRAQARWLVVVALAGLLSAAVLWKITRPPLEHTARVILRIEESDLLADQSPVVGAGLADYLLEAALRNDELAALLERHDIYTWERTLSDEYAANALRSELDVDVYRNYFTLSRGDATGNRMARISIRYTDADPERAMLVAREVAEMMITTESKNRRRSSVKLAAVARTAAEAAEARLDALTARRVKAEVDLEALEGKAQQGTEAARLRVAVRGLTAAAEEQTKRLSQARVELQSIDFRNAIVGNRLGVDFGIVDERPPPLPQPLGVPLVAMLSIFVFVFVLPLAAIAVGAFDVRVHDSADVERLGLPMLGRLTGD